SAIVPSATNTWSPRIIDPSTGLRRKVSSSTRVPRDTISVDVGGRDLPDFPLGEEQGGAYTALGSTSWLQRLKSRGEPGALGPAPTDFSPALSSITFDTVGTSWHFGLT